MKIRITPPDIDRFRTFISLPDSQDGCWEWKGAKNKKNNRAKFWVDGNTRTAAVVSYLIYMGKIEDGAWVLHRCDNPSCVNPKHLFLGSNSDNMKDMAQKGRREYKADKSPSHKLTNTEVAQIRIMVSGGMKQKHAAKIFGVTQSNISHIARRKTFAEVY